MKGDFSRLTFDPRKQFSRVLMQQGRVQLDADWNEQSAILLHYLQTLAADLIGPFGGPVTPAQDGVQGGFGIAKVVDSAHKPVNDRYQLTPGHYYVDGLLLENGESRFSEKPGTYLPGTLDHKRTYVLFLDAWERDVTFIQDDGIREVALGGPDTCLRSQVAWRVRAVNENPDGKEIPQGMEVDELLRFWSASWVVQWQPLNRGHLQARARADSKDPDACTASPEASFRGLENQLYRVEIHLGGESGRATFKWSRDNGSVTFAIRRLAGDVAFLEHLGREARTGLKPGDWVELLDDDGELRDNPGILLQVEETDEKQTSVKLKPPKDVTVNLPDYNAETAGKLHPYLRRWDYSEGKPAQGVPKLVAGALAVTEGTNDEAWLNLEDGVQIRFQPGATYRAGDYWLIPARTATGDVEWPGPVGQPETRPPLGIDHHYAPLAIVTSDAVGALTIKDARKLFSPVRLVP